MNYLKQNSFKILAVFGVLAASAFGVIDASAAIAFVLVGDVEPGTLKELNAAMKQAFAGLQDNIKKSQDLAQTAIDQLKRGDEVHAKTADDLKKLGEETQKSQKEFVEKLNSYAERMQAVEQKLDKKPAQEQKELKTAGQVFAESDAYKQMITSKGWNSLPVEIQRKAAILNPNPLSNDNPLVPAQRLPGVIVPAQRRFTIRDLMPQIPTGSNLIEFAQELVFTNNAGPQYDGSSPSATTEGAAKNESGITFQLANAPVVTIAHYIPASRQILADATGLAGYIDSRLTYGLKLEEEDELLNAAGTAGKLNGLRNQATAFSGGVTNQTAIDTLLKAFTQVSLSYFEATGVVMHPTDWMNVLLLKDTTGRYLFGDPHSANTPSIWGKTVVPTAAMTQGQFLTGAFDLAAAIYDRETVTIRVAEQHSDWFTRNLVAILCEERLALALYRSAAIVTGGLSYAG